MQVFHFDSEVVIILAQILSHALGQRGDQNAFIALNGAMNFLEQILHLAFGRSHFDLGIYKPGWANHLLDDNALALFHLEIRGRGRDVDHLVQPLFEFIKAQRAVIHG